MNGDKINMEYQLRVMVPNWVGHTNNTPSLNFKIEASDNLFNENTSIKFDFDINELNKDPEGFQENTIVYIFSGDNWVYKWKLFAALQQCKKWSL